MNNQLYSTLQPFIEGNDRLREPQVGAYIALSENSSSEERELGVVLPVGCGKSGLIAITPFAFRARRTLVIAPTVKIADQLFKKDFNISSTNLFVRKCRVLSAPPFPEPAEIRSEKTSREDLDDADVVVTNIHQIQGTTNRWINELPSDYFDLILFDEAHHNVADSWEALRQKFPGARIVNYSATPMRADGNIMAGKTIYSYPVVRAIEKGYVKELTAKVLNPRTLEFVFEGETKVIPLDEVVRMGETDSDFRKSIVTSPNSLNTIVSASIRELESIRSSSGDRRHKIIAAAMNYRHCIQVCEAYRACSLRAEFVHSNEEGKANEAVLRKLENDELDVIVQVRKLGEGFDHPYLSVAAVFAVFSNLSPFVQFVGRIMRVVDQNNPSSLNNKGTVIYHAGSNIAKRWSDFQEFSQADQAYFSSLLPEESLDFASADELTVTPIGSVPSTNPIHVEQQSDILIEEIPLFSDDKARNAFEYLRSQGMTADQYKKALELEPIIPSRQAARTAGIKSINDQITIIAAGQLKKHGINGHAKDLDKLRLNRTNYELLVVTIHTNLNNRLGRKKGVRSQLNHEEIEVARGILDELAEQSIKEIQNGKT